MNPPARLPPRTLARPLQCALLTMACGAETSTDDAPVSGHCEAIDLGLADPFIDCIDAFVPSAGVSFGHNALPSVVTGPPMGSGPDGGSNDIVSLGCGGMITLYFDEPRPRNGPGPDFIIFENPFTLGRTTFTEPARVLASPDGIDWREFPCAPEGTGVWPPLGCAGIEPVFADDASTAVDPAMAGGDQFDLADLDLDVARYIRLIDVTEEHYGERTWCAGPAGGFDLDAIAVVEAPQ